MGLFDLFKRKEPTVNWEEVKHLEEVYPGNSISVITAQTEEGKLSTGWVDMAYVNYPYKGQCPYDLQFNVEIPEDLDMGTVEDYFVGKLREGCIAHPVSRLATDFGLIMDIYIDDQEFAAKMLQDLYLSEDKLVEFGCGFNHDPKWKEYMRITKHIG